MKMCVMQSKVEWEIIQGVLLLRWSTPGMHTFFTSFFYLFINDVAGLLKKENCGISVGDALIYILLYADDIALVANERDARHTHVSEEDPERIKIYNILNLA